METIGCVYQPQGMDLIILECIFFLAPFMMLTFSFSFSSLSCFGRGVDLGTKLSVDISIKCIPIVFMTAML